MRSEANATITVSVTDVTGEWVSAAPNSTPVNGLNTNVISWGQSTGSGQSAYEFDGATGGPYDVDQIFNAGTFTHFNNNINGDSITGAQLQVEFKGTVADGASSNFDLISTFDFAHLETPNSANPCADGGTVGSGVDVNGCADRVTFAVNPGATDSVTIDGEEYVLTLMGFLVGGNPASEFWTVEGANNTATLEGVLTKRTNIVPIPAALPIMAAALGGFGFAGWRQRKHA
jgi:hypothetical protein